MSSIQVRGYAILTALKFVDTALSPAERERVVNALGGPSGYEARKDRKPVEWYPASDLAAVFEGISGLADGNSDKALERFIELGRFVGTEATNTFLRLFMRIMTPKLFANRLPTLFERDHSGSARLIVDRAEDGILVCTFKGVKGFNHVTAVGVGWVAFGLEAMNKTVLDWKCTNWSLQNPAPEEATVEVKWRD
jgi:hypothetical protein